MSTFSHQERRDATNTLIQEARAMLPAVESLHPRWTTASRAILDRLYAPELNGSEIVVPAEHQNDQSIPVVMLSAAESVRVPGAASTLTLKQQREASQALASMGEPCPDERVGTVQRFLAAGDAREYALPGDARAVVALGTLGVRSNGEVAEIGLRPLVLIKDRLAAAHRDASALRAFHAAVGITLLHETMHVDQAETTDAATVYRNAAVMRLERTNRRELQRVRGERRAYEFQRDIAAALREQPMNEQYEPRALEQRYDQAVLQLATLTENSTERLSA